MSDDDMRQIEIDMAMYREWFQSIAEVVDPEGRLGQAQLTEAMRMHVGPGEWDRVHAALWPTSTWCARCGEPLRLAFQSLPMIEFATGKRVNVHRDGCYFDDERFRRPPG